MNRRQGTHRTICRRALLCLAACLLLSALPSSSQSQNGEGETGTGRGDGNGRRRGGGGIGIDLDLGGLFRPRRSRPDLAKTLAENGPLFPEIRSRDAFWVQGFARGGWPVVLDFKLDRPGLAWVEVTAEGVAPFYYRLDGTRTDRQLVMLRLPPRFGDKPAPALFVVRTFAEGEGELTPLPLQVLGIGAGPRAVGSVAVDSVFFGPQSIRTRQKEKATYRFHCKSDFNKVAVEIHRIWFENGNFQMKRIKRDTLKGGVRRDSWVGRNNDKTWDGKAGRRVSQGAHLLQVLAWTNAASDRDWVAALSEDQVSVSD